MGFLKKKTCDVCGAKIGLLGNRKLEDGNICKTCAKKLSPWFSERRNSSLADINQQLIYREDNKRKVSAFNVSRELGSNPRVLIDDKSNNFMVSFDEDYINENPDVININDVSECALDIDEKKTEIMRLDKDGKEISHMIRRYDYSYDFYVDISIDNPYFDNIRFKLNSFAIDGNSRHEYDEYKSMGDAICDNLRNRIGTLNLNETKQKDISASKTTAFCPHCGAPTKANGSNFCQSCGSPLI